MADNALTGAAGEYHVAAQLSMRGWLATVTIKNAPTTDVLAKHAQVGSVVAIQTKTTGLGGQKFRVGQKDERPSVDDHEWYVFVQMTSLDARPDFYTVPRDHVSALLWVNHWDWLAQPGRKGQAHKDSAIRVIHPKDIQPYRERWDALLEPASQMPYALPEWWNAAVGTYGLPPGHRDAKRWPATSLPG